MLKLRLIQPGKPDEHFTFSNNRAVVGRKRETGVDIVVPQPFISGRHVLILKGVVICDLGSANGTFLANERIKDHQPTLVPDGAFTLGREEVRFVVEAEAEEDVGLATLPAQGFQSPASVTGSQLAELRVELERTREEKIKLSNEIETLRKGPSSSGAETLKRLDQALQDNADLKRRVASLRTDLEAREVEAASSLQARLAQERMVEVQKLNVELEARVKSLESRKAEVQVVAGEDAISVRLLELQAQIAEHERVQRSLRLELESAREANTSGKAAPPASELFFRLQRENQELREKVTRLEALGSAPGGGGAVPASNLFFQMQSENRELRDRIKGLEAQSPVAASRPEPTSSSFTQERAALEAEVQRLRTELARGPRPNPSGAPPVPSAFPVQSGSNTENLLRQLADEDVEGKAARLTGRVDDFLTLEAFRFVRDVEKMVTRLVGDFRQMFDPQTLLPDISGNLRVLTRAALNAPDNPKPREALLRYLEEMKAWLVASVSAPRQAALAYVRELKSDLSAESLTRNDPISAMRRLMANETELWRRAEKRWNQVTETHVDERIVELTRAEAMKLMNRAEPG